MSSEDGFPGKREYFANEDFEKTVQNIISSPRKGKHYDSDSEEISIFNITDKQKTYYTKCFLHLLKSTQNNTLLTGALYGGESKVVEFFKKSKLPDEDLSKIWQLSDVNDDGWLDLAEFSTAMHLIVLRVKGEVAIPNRLPLSIQPPVTPSRAVSQISPSSPRNATSNPTQSTQWSLFDEADGIPSSTRSEERLPTSDPPLAQFSDVPPLLVDGRPTAIRGPLPLSTFPDSNVLSLKSPQGPPPPPPPRPVARGHMRSASLDLKQLALQQGAQNGVSTLPYISRGALPSTSRHMSLSCHSTVASSSAPPPVPSRLEMGSGGLPEAFKVPAVPCPTTKPPIIDTNTPATQPVLSPPVPLPPRKKSTVVERVEKETQTDQPYTDPEMVENFIKEFGSQLQDLLGKEDDASDGGSVVERWARRCEGLRLQNIELERERARLAQVRIQLELRVQEIEEKQKGQIGDKKPTQL